MIEFFDGSDLEFQLLTDFPSVDEPEEDEDTFEKNALLKARYFGDRFGVPTIGEDSGIILEAFPDKFGLRTRRELNAKTDEEWLAQFMALMQNQENRRATFYSAMGFYDPNKNIDQVFLGATSGTILEDLAAPIEKGIPISAIYVPEGCDKAFSEMSKEEKNAVSHRGKSAMMMREWLGQLTINNNQ